MARKWCLFFSRLSTLKYLFFGTFLSLLIIFSPNQTIAAPTPGQLNQRGFTQLHQGLTSAALQTWESAYRAYKKLNDTEGMRGSLINQSLALQANASYSRACQTLIQALKMENWVCQPIHLQRFSQTEYQERLNQALQNQPLQNVQVVGLRNLGDVLRQLGNPEASSLVLNKAREIAQNFGLEAPNLLLSLAHTERSLFEQAKSRYNFIDEPLSKQEALNTAQVKLMAALELYQNINTIPAQLNQLSLLLESSDPNPQLIQSLVQALLTNDHQFAELPTIEAIYARIQLAQSLIKINDKLSTALALSQTALSLADELDNQRAKSSALGTLANVYIHLGQESKSIKYLSQAMGIAQSAEAWDIAYEWQWQLGQLYNKSHRIQEAIQAYAAAIHSLELVRSSILSLNPEIQFAFKDKVEPVYQEYMELLLSQDNINFRQIIQTQEQLKLAELENFLQCGSLIPKFSLLDVQDSYIKIPHTIYLIKLKNKIEVILRNPEGDFYHHNLELNSAEDSINTLIKFLQNQRFNSFAETDFMIYPQSLYKLLLAPISKYLPETGNLIFVLDTYFQNLPISMLHDGEKYLIDSYNISVPSSSQFYQDKAFKPGQLRALVAAISEESPSFRDSLVPPNLNPLPEVKAEIKNIRKNTVSTSELLNHQFTSDRFRQKIGNSPLPVVHVSTHAQFSSDPEQTFILAWDRPMNLLDLNALLKRQNSQSSIDLLVLSACQTAKGDRRSALGIAGLAAQSGARSTIATLWLVNSDSTVQLISKFYEGLKNGLPKAEALRQAQLSLLSNPKYTHPYYWAAFVLVGAWD
ncbi:CHAT domain-containing protein [Nodularia spumigena CS-586/05]|uniref:CHAT domain-containing protein n=1 Tax=Nodularia spumigena TaxID=70799 RepID=UPI002330D7B6|nr:CHAT domain-containing protein [Nodularia spumigena]MDB9371024.1 CHAT domain-containing protein [Nodularia spumigena CS-586/05]